MGLKFRGKKVKDGRPETGDGRPETGDRRQKTEDVRRKTGDRRRERCAENNTFESEL
jgi:hypothetical protein